MLDRLQIAKQGIHWHENYHLAVNMPVFLEKCKPTPGFDIYLAEFPRFSYVQRPKFEWFLLST